MPIHLDTLTATVKSLGISLNVWRPKESGKKVDWTPLLGEKRLLLRKLPSHFSKLLPPERAPIVQKLWTVSKTNINEICNESMMDLALQTSNTSIDPKSFIKKSCFSSGLSGDISRN